MTTLIDQAVDAFVASVTGTPEAVGGVFEDRRQAFTVDDDKAIEINLRDADSQTFGDNSPLRSLVNTVLQVELAIYTRAAMNGAGVELPARKLANPIWASWRAESADGTAGWATHTYEITLAMREHNLLAPQ